MDAASAGSPVACPQCGQTISVPQLARLAPSRTRGWIWAFLGLIVLLGIVSVLLLFKMPEHPSAPSAESTVSLPALPDNLARNLMLYFNFGSQPAAGSISDLSGHGNNGQAVNVQWVADGHRGGCMQFGPTNSYIRVPDNDSLNPSNMTLAAWIQTSFTDRNWRRIFDKAYGQEFDLTMGGDNAVGGPDDGKSWRGQVALEVAHQWAPSGVKVADGRWHQVVGTFDGSDLRIFVDGRQMGHPHRAKGQPRHAAYDLTIGANRSTGSPEEMGVSFNGSMDDVMMFNRALSPDDVTALYNLQKTASDTDNKVSEPAAPPVAPSAASTTNAIVTVDFNTTTATGSPYAFGGDGYPQKAQQDDIYPKLLKAGITSIRGDYNLEEIIPSRICASVDDYRNNVNNIQDPTNWDYSHLYWIDAAKKNGLRTMMLVDFCPPWLSWNGKRYGVPGDWNVWEDIVRKVYTRYRSKTDWVESWNEPDWDSLDIKGSPYATREDAAVDIWYHTEVAIRSVNPKAITGGFALAWQDMDMLQNILGKAIATYGTAFVKTNLNFISWHEYNSDPGALDPGAVRGALAGWGLNSDIPIFVDEWTRLKWNPKEEQPQGTEEIGFVGRALSKFVESGVAANIQSLYPYNALTTNTVRDNSFYIVNPGGRTGKLMLRTLPFHVLSKELGLGKGYYAVKQISAEQVIDACAAVNSEGQKVVFIANYHDHPNTATVTLKGLSGNVASVVEYWAAERNRACVTNTITVNNGTGVCSVNMNAQTCVGLIVKD